MLRVPFEGFGGLAARWRSVHSEVSSSESEVEGGFWKVE
jgi:hypothetical protein